MSSEAEDYGAEILFNSAGNRVYVSSRVTGEYSLDSLDPNTEDLARSCSIKAPGQAFYPGRGPPCDLGPEGGQPPHASSLRMPREKKCPADTITEFKLHDRP